MAVVQRKIPEGRDFAAEELVGRQIRIESPVPQKGTQPTGYNLMLFVDGVAINNACKLELSIEPDAVVEARVTLWRFDQATEDNLPTEVAVLRDNIELSFSAIVSEVQ